jgi:AcrR family transcriptional regulator
MRDEKKKARHEAITQAAYNLLAAKGYSGTSMLGIAKAAQASNETLYRWYGDKRGLFETMVRDNAEHIKIMLEQAIEERDAPTEALGRIAPVLLAMLLGERAILLNRVAAADPSGELGAAIAAGGRNVVQPLIEVLMTGIGEKQKVSAQELTGWFLNLLIGDLQIRRVIGVYPLPTKAQIEERCQMALRAFFKLLKEN